jgi:hypothetical protein
MNGETLVLHINNGFKILCENALKIKIGQAEITRQAMNISA